ncbi:terpene synthase family protein [Streptomyces uncialis]|uniref:Uncharacterized protein n=1 Tax=Streptomyces uncialis TaxID=1048205 RepID=A0A1Q4V389_9ACTN|nr:hypothetical protein [Streptomyces uncialis]OKH92308.1 hypothetical protein AB852_25695 [Streptomyces uncialis]
MTHYTLPPLYSPVRPELHPDAELIQDRTTRWMRTTGLCATPEAERAVGNVMAGDMAARWSPRQPRERVQWVSDFWCLGAVLDDQRLEAGDGSPAVVGPFIGELWPVISDHRGHRPTDADPPVLRGVYDITRRAYELSTPMQADRYVAGFGAWLLGVLRDDARWDRLGLGDFLRYRFGAVAAQLMLDVANVACVTAVPAAAWHDPKTVAAGRAAMMTAALDNDMVSYGKEHLRARATGVWPGPNVVRFLELNGHSVQDAFARTAEIRNGLMCLWRHLLAELLPAADPATAAYLRGLDLLVAGNLRHHLTSSRYHNPDGRHPHAVTFSASFTERCPVTDHRPPTAALAWWWRQREAPFHSTAPADPAPPGPGDDPCDPVPPDAPAKDGPATVRRRDP